MLLRKLLLVRLVALAACGGSDGAGPDPGPGTTPSGEGWATAARMNEPRQEVGVAAIEDRIYVAGGFRGDGTTANTLEAYDVGSGSWSTLAPMPEALNHCAAVAFGGKLYIIGGSTALGPPTAAAYEYDPAGNDWAVRSSMARARSAAMAAVVGNRIFVAGGTLDRSETESYDPVADQWTSLPEMPTPRNHLAGGTLVGRFHAVGGRPGNIRVMEVFDPAMGAWSTRASMPTGRSGHAATVFRGCLYVFGGEGNTSRPDGIFPQNEVYDPRTDTWESLAPMPTPRHGIGAVAVGGRIYIPGGAMSQGLDTTAVHEVFTPPAGKSCE
jgi:N-acetylneuraminic acid mutarotase